MGDLSDNFSRHEFVCGCGCDKEPTIDAEMINVVQDCVDHFSRLNDRRMYVTVLSGFRCKLWNAYIWGKRNMARVAKGLEEEKPAWNSKHTTGKAIDFTIRGISPDAVYNYLDKKYPNKYGIGKYPDRTHFDPRTEKYCWESNS